MKKSNNPHKLILIDCGKAMWPSLLGHILCNLFSTIIAIYTTQKLGKLTEAIFSQNADWGYDSIFELVICVSALVFIVPLVGLFANLLMLKYSLIHDRMILSRYLDKTYAEATNITLGEAQSRLEGDAIDLRYYWIGIIERVINTPIVLFVLLINSLRINLLFTVVVVVVSSIKLIVPMAIRKIESKYDQKNRVYHDLIKTYEMGLAENPHTLKLLGLTRPWLEQIDKKYQTYFDRIFCKSVKCTSMAKSISSFLDTFCVLCILLVGAILVSSESITAGGVTIMIGYFSVYSQNIQNIEFIIRKIPIINNIIERLSVFYDHVEDCSGEEVGLVESISANGLSFYYGDKEIFHGIDFHITTGTKTAICGANGCGKSTLLKVICGMLTMYTGELKLNNSEMRSVSIESWRSQFAFVEQNPYLFAGSVKENIRLGNLNATDKELNEVLHQCGIEYLAGRTISIDQNNLSGGEKQKISIARALLKNPSYLVMDEPSNNLDKASIKWLHDFIKDSSKTLIYISHDEELQELAEQVIFIQ